MINALLVLVAILFFMLLYFNFETWLHKFTLCFLNTVHSYKRTHELFRATNQSDSVSCIKMEDWLFINKSRARLYSRSIHEKIITNLLLNFNKPISILQKKTFKFIRLNKAKIYTSDKRHYWRRLSTHLLCKSKKYSRFAYKVEHCKIIKNQAGLLESKVFLQIWNQFLEVCDSTFLQWRVDTVSISWTCIHCDKVSFLVEIDTCCFY